MDCMVYAQAMISPRGPAARCVARGAGREFRIVLSPYIVSEILELPRKLPPKFALTDEKVSQFLAALVPKVVVIDHVPHIFDHPIDPDDSPYVNLAIATHANVIVSRDRHLLGLTNPAKPWSKDFRMQYPNFKIMTPEMFLAFLPQPK